MNGNLSMIRPLLRKDVQLFWPFAALTAALFALAQFPGVMGSLGPVAGLVQVAMQFAFVLLILVVFYEDAVVSVKHDWLSRPIAGTTVLLEKCLFVALSLVVPRVLGGFVNGLAEGHSFGESLVTGLGLGADGGTLMFIAMVMAFASVTANIRQAFIVILSAVAAMALCAALASRFAGPGDFVGISSAGWVVSRSIQLLLGVSAVAVLWVQYRHRHTRSARLIAGATVAVAVALLVGVNWTRAFAVQKLLAPEADAPEAAVALNLPEGCFPLRRFTGVSGEGSSSPPDEGAQERLRSAGEGPLSFKIRLTGAGGSVDRRVVVDHTGVSWYSGATQEFYSPGAFWSTRGRLAETSPDAERNFILPRAEYTRLAAIGNVQAHVDYSLSVLAPTAAAEFVANGERVHHAGLGWCGAAVDPVRGNVAVSCYKPGAQPALLVASLVGTPDSEAMISRPLDYSPAFLDFWGGQRHRMVLKHTGGEAPRVKITAYEARAHFDSHHVVPGVLGGPVSACPAP